MVGNKTKWQKDAVSQQGRGDVVCPDKDRYRRALLEQAPLEGVKRDLLSPVAWGCLPGDADC